MTALRLALVASMVTGLELAQAFAAVTPCVIGGLRSFHLTLTPRNDLFQGSGAALRASG